MSQIAYRQAVESEVPLLAKLRAQERGSENYWHARISGYLNHNLHPQEALEPRVIFVAFYGDGLAGFIAGHLTRRYDCGGELQWINVQPTYRRQGIASELLRILAVWFSDHDVRRVCVDVDPKDDPARYFYKKHGAGDLNQHWMVWDDITTIIPQRKLA